MVQSPPSQSPHNPSPLECVFEAFFFIQTDCTSGRCRHGPLAAFGVLPGRLLKTALGRFGASQRPPMSHSQNSELLPYRVKILDWNCRCEGWKPRLEALKLYKTRCVQPSPTEMFRAMLVLAPQSGPLRRPASWRSAWIMLTWLLP
uniref:Uncharacterized protein n=1 Tax=Eutreptiella gymnastica TaxID=73025 RepID=A0A7S1JDG7_9EUGL